MKNRVNMSIKTNTGNWLYFCLFFILPCLLPFPSYSASDTALSAGLVSHRALYDVRLSSKESNAAISNIKGKMFYEWRDECEEWVSNHHFDVLYDYMELPAQHVKSNFSTYESHDGERFFFNVQRNRSDQISEDLRGAAQPGLATYTHPEDLVILLPEGTVFPTAHTLKVLNAIKQGVNSYSTILFDGSDDKGPVDVNSFIGQQVSYKKHEELDIKDNDINMSLLNGKAWRVHLAFFPLAKEDVTAQYEMSVVFHENGIISAMDIDYGDFSVAQKLVALEPLEAVCDGSSK